MYQLISYFLWIPLPFESENQILYDLIKKTAKIINTDASQEHSTPSNPPSQIIT